MGCWSTPRRCRSFGGNPRECRRPPGSRHRRSPLHANPYSPGPAPEVPHPRGSAAFPQTDLGPDGVVQRRPLPTRPPWGAGVLPICCRLQPRTSKRGLPGDGARAAPSDRNPGGATRRLRPASSKEAAPHGRLASTASPAHSKAPPAGTPSPQQRRQTWIV